jgi:hypothetical protein
MDASGRGERLLGCFARDMLVSWCNGTDRSECV